MFQARRRNIHFTAKILISSFGKVIYIQDETGLAEGLKILEGWGQLEMCLGQSALPGCDRVNWPAKI